MIAAEWCKIATLPWLRWTAAAILPMLVGVAVFVGRTGSLEPDDTVLGGSLSGAPLGQCAAAVFGVLLIAGEYATGMIRTTFLANPRRWSVLGAKALVGFGVVSAVSAVSVVAAWLVGAHLLADAGHLSGQPFPALIGVTLGIGAAMLLGLAIAVLLRSTAAAIAAALAVVILPGMLAPLLGDFHVMLTVPSPQVAVMKLAQSSDTILLGGPGPWPSLAAVALTCAAALGIAATVLARRDA